MRAVSTVFYQNLTGLDLRLYCEFPPRGAEVAVALCAERSAELVMGALAILKVGGFYVPLDPSYPRDRLAWPMRASTCISCPRTRRN